MHLRLWLNRFLILVGRHYYERQTRRHVVKWKSPKKKKKIKTMIMMIYFSRHVKLDFLIYSILLLNGTPYILIFETLEKNLLTLYS